MMKNLSQRHVVTALKRSILHVPSVKPADTIHVRYDGTSRGFDAAVTKCRASCCETTCLILDKVADAVDIGNVGGVVIEKLGAPIIVIENTEKIRDDVALINLTSFRIAATHTMVEMEREKTNIGALNVAIAVVSIAALAIHYYYTS